jgi:hypothetical protein
MALKSEDFNPFSRLPRQRLSSTSASTRENRPDHGSCLRNTRARLLFPVMTGVIKENGRE